MLRYAAGRLVIMVPTVVVLSLVLFILMRLTPGSPLQPIAPNANPLSPSNPPGRRATCDTWPDERLTLRMASAPESAT